MEKKETPVLSAAIADKFKMAKGFNAGKYVHGNYSIDTTKCTEADAEKFLLSGSKVLERIVKDDTKGAVATKK